MLCADVDALMVKFVDFRVDLLHRNSKKMSENSRLVKVDVD